MPPTPLRRSNSGYFERGFGRKMIIMIKKRFYQLLLYLTNNEKISKDEVKFDIFFFVLLMIDIFFIGIPAVIFNCGQLDKLFWVIALFIWIWDNLRHNRE